MKSKRQINYQLISKSKSYNSNTNIDALVDKLKDSKTDSNREKVKGKLLDVLNLSNVEGTGDEIVNELEQEQKITRQLTIVSKLLNEDALGYEDVEDDEYEDEYMVEEAIDNLDDSFMRNHPSDLKILEESN